LQLQKPRVWIREWLVKVNQSRSKPVSIACQQCEFPDSGSKPDGEPGQVGKTGS
jgi:hypothetical protein